MAFRVRFWGVRGSIPAPGPGTAEFGGNTACVEVRTSRGDILIFDSGTGIRECGLSLLKELPVQVRIFITHTHWDHIQGFPFFVPAFIKGSRIDFYGPYGLSDMDAGLNLKSVIELQSKHEYFPIRAGELQAAIDYHDLKEGVYDLDGVTLRTRYLNHPVRLLGYRVEWEGRAIVYTGDNEPFYDSISDPEEDDEEFIEENRLQVEALNDRVVDFVRGADLMVADAQYTPQEYPSKRGWGHSSWDDVIRLAVKAGVKRVALFHHEPTRDDEGMRRLEADAKALAATLDPALEVFAAREKMAVEV